MRPIPIVLALASTSAACADAADHVAPTRPAPESAALEAGPELAPAPAVAGLQVTPNRFSWVDDGLAGMAYPGSGARLEAVLAFLEAEGVDLVVTLTEDRPIAPEVAQAHALATLHLPVVDFTPPTLEQLQAFVDAVAAARTRGERVAVHCGAGLGRTGTMLAAWFIANGLPADEAIAKVRALRPGSIETQAQEAILYRFAAP